MIEAMSFDVHGLGQDSQGLVIIKTQEPTLALG